MQVSDILKKTMISMGLILVCLEGNAGENKTVMPGKTVSDFKTSLSEALSSNPEILMQRAEQDVSTQKVAQAVGAYLPTLDLRAGAGKEYVKQAYRENSLASIDTRGSETKNRYDPSITLNQKIFDGLETPYEINKKRKELYQSTKNLEEAQLLIAFSVMDKYIAVRRFERLVKLAKENVKTHEGILVKIKKLVKGGKATSGDEKNVLSRLYDAEAAVGYSRRS